MLIREEHRYNLFTASAVVSRLPTTVDIPSPIREAQVGPCCSGTLPLNEVTFAAPELSPPEAESEESPRFALR